MKRLLWILLLAAGCSQKPAAGPVRVAVLRFDDLTGEPSLAYAARGATHALAAELAAGGRLRAAAADGEDLPAQRAAAIAAGVPRVLHGYVSRVGGRLRLRGELEDAASGRIVQWAEASGAASAGVLPLVHAAARSLDPGARGAAFTKHEQALAAYVEALEASSADQALESIERAVTADPDFGPGYLAWMRLALARRDRALVEKVAGLARARGSAIGEADRARLEADAAAVANNRDGQLKALADLARAAPNDANALRAAGDAHLRQRNFPAAARFYEQAAALQPADPALWNTLGYVHGFAGEVAAAARALRKYASLRPKQANPLDSLGEVHFYNGRFGEAAGFFREAAAKDPSFAGGAALGKTAVSLWLSGDRAGGSARIQEYLEQRRAAKDPLAEYRQAEWEYATGNSKSALDRVVAFAQQAEQAGQREAAATAYVAAGLWSLDQADRKRARELAAAAVKLAQGTAVAPVAGLLAFASNPSAPAAEWNSRAARAFADPRLETIRPVFAGYALLFDGHAGEAVAPLRRAVEAEAPGPAAATPVLLAWALAESGNKQEAARLLRFTPVLPFVTPAPLNAVLLRRLPELRAKAR